MAAINQENRPATTEHECDSRPERISPPLFAR
jgi:hypothetical protein